MAVRNSKALIGALFIQYIIYAIFYLFDEIFKKAPNHYKAVTTSEPVMVEQPAVGVS